MKPRYIAALLALITALVYLPTSRQPFLTYDDPDYVTENPTVQAGITLKGVHWAFASAHSSNWHPLTWLSHMLDCELFGLRAGSHHLVNVVFHAANTALVFLLVFQLTGAMWPAAMIAALFGWHPEHVESVAWISERKDVLSTLFGLLALVAYAQARGGYTHRLSPIAYRLSLPFFACSLLSKPMLVTLPFVMLLMDWVREVSGAGCQVSGKVAAASAPSPDTSHLAPGTLLLPFFALSAVFCVITFLAQRAESVMAIEQFPIASRLGNAVVACVRYLINTIWPVDLAILYPLRRTLPAWQIAGAVAVLIAISLLAFRLRRRVPYFLFGWLWFLGTLVPVIGLVQVGAQAMADRYSYVPSIGLFTAVVFGVRDFAMRFRWPAAPVRIATALILAACIVGTERQLRYWRDSEALFTHTLAVTTANPIAEANLGFALYHDHKSDEALVHLEKALKLLPDFADAHNTAGLVLFEQGRIDEACAHYDEALRLRPDHAKAHYNLGNALLRQSRVSEAIPHYESTIRLNPSQLEARNNLAWILATSPQSELRNGTRAVALAREANDLAAGRNPDVLSTLAAALAEAGQFREAESIAQNAMRIGGATNAAFANATQAQLESYRVGKAFRDAQIAVDTK